jgi:hypothetical protein
LLFGTELIVALGVLQDLLEGCPVSAAISRFRRSRIFRISSASSAMSDAFPRSLTR